MKSHQIAMSAAAAMLVIPVYIYRNMHLHDVVIFGELLAVSVIIMCLMFVMADLVKRFDLLASVGSDYHGPENRWVELGRLDELPEGCTPIWHDWQ